MIMHDLFWSTNLNLWLGVDLVKGYQPWNTIQCYKWREKSFNPIHSIMVGLKLNSKKKIKIFKSVSKFFFVWKLKNFRNNLKTKLWSPPKIMVFLTIKFKTNQYISPFKAPCEFRVIVWYSGISHVESRDHDFVLYPTVLR